MGRFTVFSGLLGVAVRYERIVSAFDYRGSDDGRLYFGRILLARSCLVVIMVRWAWLNRSSYENSCCIAYMRLVC